MSRCPLCDVPGVDATFGRTEVWRDDLWRLTTSLGPGDPTAGFSYLEPIRHISYIHELDGEEAASFGPVLARCDADNLPAYLECSREENVAFYARHGFACSGEVRLPGGPPLWLMWRVPRR